MGTWQNRRNGKMGNRVTYLKAMIVFKLGKSVWPKVPRRCWLSMAVLMVKIVMMIINITILRYAEWDQGFWEMFDLLTLSHSATYLQLSLGLLSFSPASFLVYCELVQSSSSSSPQLKSSLSSLSSWKLNDHLTPRFIEIPSAAALFVMLRLSSYNQSLSLLSS